MSWYKQAQSFKFHKFANEIEDFLTQISTLRSGNTRPVDFVYENPEDFVLQHGKHFVSEPMTQEEMTFLKTLAARTKHYKMKQCFYNAQSLAHISSQIKYIEGYLLSSLFPIQHAWNSLNGKVLDFTISHANKGNPVLGEIPQGWDYFGVELSTPMIMKYWRETETSGPLIDNWQQKFPLLKQPFKTEETEETDNDLA